MSLVVKLKQRGAKKSHTYKIVVAESRSKRDGKSVAEIGYYNPLVKPPIIFVDKKNLSYWQEKGAKLSQGVAKILNERSS